MMNRRLSFVLGLLLLALMMVLSGCTSSRTRIRYRPFLEEEASRLEVGMPVSEVRTLFGDPAVSYALELGQDTAEAWDGYVLEYWVGQDPEFVAVKRAKKNRLVFAIAGTDTLLNNWSLEHVAPGADRE